jgi:hypothetical protein
MATAQTATESSKPKFATPDFLSHGPKKLLIGGKWVPAKSGKTFETINPATEEVLGLIAEGDKADVDEAVKAARTAYEGKWSLMNPHERARLLLKVADLLDKYADEIAMLESLDNGKPLAQARMIDARGAANVFRYFAGWPSKIYGETNPSDPTMFNYTLREPMGVCGLIVPWNFPLLMAVQKVARPSHAAIPWCSSRPSRPRSPRSNSVRFSSRREFPRASLTSSPDSARAPAARSPSIPTSTK